MVAFFLAWLRVLLRPKPPDRSEDHRLIAELKETPPVLREARRRVRSGDPVTELAAGSYDPRRRRYRSGP